MTKQHCIYLICLVLLAVPSFGQTSAPTLPDGKVTQLLGKALQRVNEERFEEARKLFKKAWQASDAQSVEAVMGMAQTSALLMEPREAEKHARTAVDLAKDNQTKSAAALLYGASTYQVLLDYEAEGPGDGKVESPMDLKVRLVAAMTLLEKGLELSEDDPTGARVLLADVYLRARLPEKARAVLDDYFESGTLEMREEAENLRCLAGGSQADFEPPPPAQEISKPLKISTPYPKYTERARKKRWQGQAVVQAVIDENGNVACVRMAKEAPYGLSENALRAVREWKFRAAEHEDQPIKTMLYLGINFKLSEGES